MYFKKTDIVNARANFSVISLLLNNPKRYKKSRTGCAVLPAAGAAASPPSQKMSRPRQGGSAAANATEECAAWPLGRPHWGLISSPSGFIRLLQILQSGWRDDCCCYVCVSTYPTTRHILKM